MICALIERCSCLLDGKHISVGGNIHANGVLVQTCCIDYWSLLFRRVFYVLAMLQHCLSLNCKIIHRFHSYAENGVIQLLAKDVRPRARTVYQWHQLEPGMVVMLNYNPDEPKERGYWYDAEIQRKRETRTQREIYAKIILG